MSEKMTDEQFHAELDDLDKQQRYAKAMMFAAREAERARTSEAEKDKALQKKDREIARLRADISAWSATANGIRQEKDATIKALADVGEQVLGACALIADGDPRAAITLSEVAERLIVALRLAGRL